MMTAWALLKDSFRETRDSKTLTVLLIIITILIILVGSIGFKPNSADQAIPSIVTRAFGEMAFADDDAGRVPSWFGSASEVKTLNPEAKFTQRKYEFVFTVTQNGQQPLHATINPWLKKRNREEIPEAQPVPKDVVKEYFQALLEDRANLKTESMTELPVPNVRNGMGIYVYQVVAMTTSDLRAWPHEVSFFFGATKVDSGAPLGMVLWFIQDYLFNGIGAGLAILLGIIVTAGFVPNMFAKGALDVIISKPVSRPFLLICKYLGGLFFILLLSIYTFTGIFVVMGLQSGLYNTGILWSIPLVTAAFAILYSVSTLIGVLTRSNITAILVTMFAAALFWAAGKFDEGVRDYIKRNPKDPPAEWVTTTNKILQTVFPRYKDLDVISSKAITDELLTPAERKMMRRQSGAREEYPSAIETTASCGGFIFVMLGLACWRFNRRDY